VRKRFTTHGAGGGCGKGERWCAGRSSPCDVGDSRPGVSHTGTFAGHPRELPRRFAAALVYRRRISWCRRILVQRRERAQPMRCKINWRPERQGAAAAQNSGARGLAGPLARIGPPCCNTGAGSRIGLRGTRALGRPAKARLPHASSGVGKGTVLA
jgi:hypothetical protein